MSSLGPIVLSPSVVPVVLSLPRRASDLDALAADVAGRTERVLLVPRKAVVEDPNTNSFRVFAIDGASVTDPFPSAVIAHVLGVPASRTSVVVDEMLPAIALRPARTTAPRSERTERSGRSGRSGRRPGRPGTRSGRSTGR